METREPVTTEESQDTRWPPSCPICGGQLTEARTLWRCPRCNYSLCEGCEGGSE